MKGKEENGGGHETRGMSRRRWGGAKGMNVEKEKRGERWRLHIKSEDRGTKNKKKKKIGSQRHQQYKLTTSKQKIRK